MKLVWTDLETTGLNPRLGKVLEVCVRVTDVKLNSLDEYYALVDPREKIETLFEANMSPRVKEMHIEQGLYEDLVLGQLNNCLVDPEQVENDLVKLFKKHNDGDAKTLYMAGSSVKFDYTWIEEHFSSVLGHCHYRLVDVSSTRVQLQSITGEDWFYPKSKKHRAREDIDESIEEYKFLWNKFADYVSINKLDQEGVF